MKWELDTRIFRANDEVLYLGKWVVGSVGYESRSKGDDKHYAARSVLPGLKTTLDYYESMGDAKKRVERATKYWLQGCGSVV